jgi:NADH-quinone oxidoreductase subunit C
MLPLFFQTLPLRNITWSNFGWHLRTSKSYIPIVISLLKMHSDSQYKSLVDVVAIDNLLLSSKLHSRFTLKYLLLSFRYQSRISLSMDLEIGSNVYSVRGVFSSAVWCEREVWDLFGIYFVGHPDLRRLLTDYGFSGHPLLKDFPLSGYKEAVYSEKGKRVTFMPVQFAQRYRRFFIDNPWVISLFIHLLWYFVPIDTLLFLWLVVI